MRKMYKVFIIAIFCSLIMSVFSPAVFCQEPIRVSFINPGRIDETFWVMASHFMQAAADDLGMELEILQTDRNHLKAVRLAKEVVQRATPPDYLIVVNEKTVADHMIQAADAAGVKVFLMINGFLGEQAVAMGAPREKYPNWIGELIPNNQHAGYQEANILIEYALAHEKRVADGKLHLLGISGDQVTHASVERVKGLEQAVVEYPQVLLKQIIPGKWNREQAYGITTKIFNRYPEIRIIWSANDTMALGVIDGLSELGKKSGEDIFLGGVNWEKEAIMAIKERKMVVSLGGHFMIGGWVMVLLHDYHYGQDFSSEGVEREYQMSVVDTGNVETYLEHLGEQNWQKIDFTRFSKQKNPTLNTYNFSLDAILHQLETQ